MPDEAKRSARMGAIGGLAASLAVALVSTWASAEAARADSLRQDRRSAYAQFLGSVRNCESLALTLPLTSELGRTDTNSTVEQSFKDAVAEFQSCQIPLSSTAAGVRLVADERLSRASDELESAAIAVIAANAAPDKEARKTAHGRYREASSYFEVTARRSVQAPLVSPLLIQTVGLVLAVAVAMVVLRWAPPRP